MLDMQLVKTTGSSSSLVSDYFHENNIPERRYASTQPYFSKSIYVSFGKVETTAIKPRPIDCNTLATRQIGEIVQFPRSAITNQPSNIANAWLDQAAKTQRWKGVYSQFERAIEKKEGWDGEGSVGATVECKKAARIVLDRLFDESDAEFLPSIGLDEDGYVVLTWNFSSLKGSLSVGPEGKFSYYIERLNRGKGPIYSILGGLDPTDGYPPVFLNIIRG